MIQYTYRNNIFFPFINESTDAAYKVIINYQLLFDNVFRNART